MSMNLAHGFTLYPMWKTSFGPHQSFYSSWVFSFFGAFKLRSQQWEDWTSRVGGHLGVKANGNIQLVLSFYFFVYFIPLHFHCSVNLSHYKLDNGLFRPETVATIQNKFV